MHISHILSRGRASRHAAAGAVALLLAISAVTWQAASARVFAQTSGTDQPGAQALAGDACPDGTIGEPPSCLAITGDTSPTLTTVMTQATLAARGRVPFSEVLGVMEMNPASRPVEAPAPIPAAVSAPAVVSGAAAVAAPPAPRGPVVNSAAVVAAAPQLPNTGTGGLLSDANPPDAGAGWLSLAAIALLIAGVADYRLTART